MKLKATDILNIHHSLEKLSDTELDLDSACIIAKDMNELAVAKGVIDAKRNKLVTEYAKRDADGNICQSDDGSVEITEPKTFSAKMEELLSSEAEADIRKIPKDALCGIKGSPKTLLPLMDIMEE